MYSSITIKRLNPFSGYEFLKTEQWLSELAHDGLFLKKYGFISTFELKAPHLMSYHICFTPKKEFDRNLQIEKYYNEGWALVHTGFSTRVFCAPANAPRSKLADISSRARKCLLSVILRFLVLNLIIITLFVLYDWHIGNHVLLRTPSLPVLFLIFINLFSLKSFVSLAKLYRKSKKYKQINILYKTQNSSMKKVFTITAVLLLLCLSFGFDVYRFFF